MIRLLLRKTLSYLGMILGNARCLNLLNWATDLIRQIENYKDILKPHDLTSKIWINQQEVSFSSRASDGMNRPLKHGLKNWESKSLTIFSELSKTSKVIVDVGSYTGIYAIIGAKSNPQSTVIAFEPNSELSSTLLENLSINSIQNVLVENVALGSRNFMTDLYVGNTSDTAPIIAGRDPVARRQKVEVRNFDSYLSLQSFQQIDLLKIDVEGYECEVLRGMERTIEKCRPIFIIEALDMHELNQQGKYLESLGYSKPLQVGRNGGDSRNYIWFTSKSSEKVLRVLTAI